jgi:hypothetical protein
MWFTSAPSLAMDTGNLDETQRVEHDLTQSQRSPQATERPPRLIFHRREQGSPRAGPLLPDRRRTIAVTIAIEPQLATDAR